MMIDLRPRLWLWLPPVAAGGADVALTLLGQAPGYWAGDYSAVEEFNPVARLLLQAHPLAFVAAAVAWWLGLLAMLLVLKSRVAVAAMFVITFCHAVAAGAWLARGGAAGVAGAIVLLTGAERLLYLSWRRAGVVASAAD